MMDFNKYCNCYNIPYGNINVQCYNTVLEVINKHKLRPDDNKVDSRLIIMKQFWPQFIQKIIIQNAFRKPVVFMQSKSYFDIHKNKE